VQGKVLQAQPKNMQQQQNMIVQQQPQQIITQAALPNQQIITNPMQVWFFSRSKCTNKK
jgi:hypothetical protein